MQVFFSFHKLQDAVVMCALTVHGNLPGKSFILLEAEEELCRAFPVAVTQLLLFLLFCGRQRFSGAVKEKKKEEEEI